MKKGRNTKHVDYAVYDYKDNLLMVGNIYECSAFTGMTVASIYSTRTKRGEEKGKSKARTRTLYTFVKLKEEEE